MRFDSVLIVTYGRSGSTLLQGVLNSIEGCVIRGENYNFIYSLYQSYERLGKAKERTIQSSLPSDAWYGAHLLDESLFIEHTAAMVRKLLLGDMDERRVKAYGFKEIRYLEIVGDLENYLEFLAKIFPNAAFILNTRNHKDVINSDWWISEPYGKLKRRLTGFERRCLEYMQGKENWFHIRYEDIVGKTEALEKLFRFLGADYSPARIDGVLAIPHSYGSTGKDFPSWQIFLHRWRCRIFPWKR